ncbi:ribosomal protein S18-alanine N-acetyltransferase [Allofustis seminis]|uniref:ribosomal protein S18-alanine N-acetyltransferase n=1 Tax=Allofustis seminis TaxID=166939 RepID=UPI00037252BB|nr:ribosomal protein S18-alanine N-acetyltransferase [Allofustis seminis]
MKYKIIERTAIHLSATLIARRLYDIAECAYELGSPWSVEQFSDTFHRHAPLFLYVIEEVATKEWQGFILGHHVLDSFDIYMIAILKESQGNGLGTCLVEHVQAAAITAGADITLEVRCSNQPALAVYQKCGFEIVSRINDYYKQPTEDAYRMVWSNKNEK